jgi:phosphopantothenoylcysteine decarboxylase/phosphopantothenate--cysteine ligase
MLAAVEGALPADIFVAAAAVADWRVENSGVQKMKKGAAGPPRLALVENPDILASIGQKLSNRPTLIVGFAAETENLIENAQRKLQQKKCDLIVANDVAEASGTFGGADNAVHLVTSTGVDSWPKMSKQDVALRLVEKLGLMLHNN